jgi:hypothetical protein
MASSFYELKISIKVGGQPNKKLRKAIERISSV